MFADLEAPTPTPNRDIKVTHFTFDLPHNLPYNYPHTGNKTNGNFTNPEYFDTDSNGSDLLNKEDERCQQKGNSNCSSKLDYYNEVNGLCSDGDSTRGSTAESTISI